MFWQRKRVKSLSHRRHLHLCWKHAAGEEPRARTGGGSWWECEQESKQRKMPTTLGWWRKSRWKSGPTIKKIWKERGKGLMETHFTYFKIMLEPANYWNRKWGWGMWKGRLIQYFLVWRAGDSIHCGSRKRHGQIVTLKICFPKGTTWGKPPRIFSVFKSMSSHH